MARLVGSTVEPETLQPDIVQDGRVRILVHWDAVQKEITDDMGTRTEWEYQEQVLWVPLPEPEYIEPGEYRPVLSAAGLAYLAANEEEILTWAQAGMTEATEAPGLRRRTQELEDAIVEMSMLLAGGGM
jgi:hypothetical protein